MDRNALTLVVCTTRCEQKVVKADTRRILLTKFRLVHVCFIHVPHRLLGLIFGLPLAIGTGLGVLVWQRGDAWKAKALDTLNEQIDGALSVGEVTLSWWHGFPDISVDVSDVALLQTTGDTLVAGERLGLALDFWSLLGDQPEIGSITLNGGRVLLELDEDGRWANSPFKPRNGRRGLFFQDLDPRHGPHSRLCVERGKPRQPWSRRSTWICSSAPWGLLRQPWHGVARPAKFNFLALRHPS